MKLTTRIGLILPVLILGLAVLAYLLGYLLPARTHLERVAYIEAAPETVYRLLGDFQRFKAWSPWSKLDPATEYRLDGPQQGLGATMQWSSEHSKIGAGTQTIIDAQPYRKLRIALDFDDGRQAIIAYSLDPLEGGTHITWTFDVEHGNNILDRYAGLMLDRRIGEEYQQGLRNLKALAESRPALPSPDIVTQTITYEIDGAPFTGYLAYDQNRADRPGILIVHDRWGQNETVRDRADQLAELGYTAFAPDMYGQDKQAESPEEAEQFSRSRDGRTVFSSCKNGTSDGPCRSYAGAPGGSAPAHVVMEHPDVARQRFLAALDVLKQQPATDPNNLAAIGYGLGGTLVLNMARMGVPLDGVVSFYGDLTSIEEPAQRGQVQASLLVFNGADDSAVSPEARQAFFEEMDTAGIDYEFIEYPGAQHGFADPAFDEYAKQFQLPGGYHAEADKKAWQKMRAFFARVFE